MLMHLARSEEIVTLRSLSGQQRHAKDENQRRKS